MNDNVGSTEHYLQLTALLIDREMGKFRRSEQGALVSFANVARLARNASEELTAEARGTRGACSCSGLPQPQPSSC